MNPRIAAGCMLKLFIMGGFNGAAGVNPRIAAALARGGATGAGLQWGRGCEPADSGVKKRKPRAKRSSFNGAAGVNPRIVTIPSIRSHSMTRASMGPRV